MDIVFSIPREGGNTRCRCEYDGVVFSVIKKGQVSDDEKQKMEKTVRNAVNQYIKNKKSDKSDK